MAETLYLRPLGVADSPQSEADDQGGAAVRLAGGLACASRFALIRRAEGRVVARDVLTAGAVEAALARLPAPLAQEGAEQWAALTTPRAPLVCGARIIRLEMPQVMGIINLTPDSFSDGGALIGDPEAAEAHAAAMLEAGAALIDIGGESTRPGASPVWEGDEITRVVPLIERLARRSEWGGAAISIDTRKLAVMAAALAAGAQVINDVSALRHDPRSAALVAEAGATVVLMHAGGDSGVTLDELHADPGYRDVVLDVFDALKARRDAAIAAGIARERIILDPGIGFGKTLAENLALMNALALFHALGCPLLVGASRKRMIGALSREAPVEKRLAGSLMLAAQALAAGVQILRVHDVAETVQLCHVWRGLRDAALTDFNYVPR